MGQIKTIPAVTATSGTPTPIYVGTTVVAVSFSITNNIATIVLGAGNLPKNGFNGPNGYVDDTLTGAKFDIHGGVRGFNNTGGTNQGAGGPGQVVTLWGFTTATYFNGKNVTVLDNDPSTGAFRFAFNHANVASTADTGNTASNPPDHFRVVRIECGQGNGTDKVYVGDQFVSSTRYAACLTLTGQIAFEISGQNIDASKIFIDATSSSDTVQVSFVY
jgi:hypothetical protein